MWQTIRDSVLGRHVHRKAYAALVLSGGYEEAGDHGRFRVTAGDVIFHAPFEAHLDRFSAVGAVVLNLALPEGCSCTTVLARVADPDAIARVAEGSARDAVERLFCEAVSCEPQLADWPDDLAAALMRNPSLKLSQWCGSNAIPPWVVSRGFKSVFGVAPETFRARIRTHHALKRICDTQTPLARIAAELGFADQSHMTRSVRQLAGIAPQAWRCAANGFKTRKIADV